MNFLRQGICIFTDVGFEFIPVLFLFLARFAITLVVANSRRILSLSSPSFRPYIYTHVYVSGLWHPPFLFSTLWRFRPYKLYIFWKSTILWLQWPRQRYTKRQSVSNTQRTYMLYFWRAGCSMISIMTGPPKLLNRNFPSKLVHQKFPPVWYISSK